MFSPGRAGFQGLLRVRERDSTPAAHFSSAVLSFATAQIKATTQPMNVHPKNKFITKMANLLLLFRITATMVGKKYAHTISVTIIAMKTIPKEVGMNYVA